MNKTCPKCGADQNPHAPNFYLCGSLRFYEGPNPDVVQLHETEHCKCRQELAALKRDAGGPTAIEDACKRLPKGWRITFSAGVASVLLHGCFGITDEICDDRLTMDEMVRQLVDRAIEMDVRMQ